MGLAFRGEKSPAVRCVKQLHVITFCDTYAQQLKQLPLQLDLSSYNAKTTFLGYLAAIRCSG